MEFESIKFCFIGRWNFGEKDYFGQPEISLIQTADCPQVGGRMLDMTQTTMSPIYGITNWPNCADICQNNPECQYWQWSQVTATCWSVTNFTGFTGDGYVPGSNADDYITGARNCPLSTDSLVTLCPSRGSNSLMWRYSDGEYSKEKEYGKFFIPESSLKEGE